MARTTHALISNNPVHLFVGPASHALRTIVSYIQEILCPEKGCTYCAICRQIFEAASPHLLWLEPENAHYTRELVQPIFDTLKLKRAGDAPFFIVLLHAERLLPGAANALLKSLEEPPAGYYFMLSAVHERRVLPTIRSRCIVHTLPPDHASSSMHQELIAHFTGVTPLNAGRFLELLERAPVSELESMELLYEIMHILSKRLKDDLHVSEQRSTLVSLMESYVRAAQLPPQAGSSKIFWKDLYLHTISYHMRT